MTLSTIQLQHRARASLARTPGYTVGLNMAQALWVLGYPDQALQGMEEALALAQAGSAHPFSVAAVLHFSCRAPSISPRASGGPGAGGGAVALCTEQGLRPL